MVMECGHGKPEFTELTVKQVNLKLFSYYHNFISFAFFPFVFRRIVSCLRALNVNESKTQGSVN